MGPPLGQTVYQFFRFLRESRTLTVGAPPPPPGHLMNQIIPERPAQEISGNVEKWVVPVWALQHEHADWQEFPKEPNAP